jgi:hypothetical protein
VLVRGGATVGFGQRPGLADTNGWATAHAGEMAASVSSCAGAESLPRSKTTVRRSAPLAASRRAWWSPTMTRDSSASSAVSPTTGICRIERRRSERAVPSLAGEPGQRPRGLPSEAWRRASHSGGFVCLDVGRLGDIDGDCAHFCPLRSPRRTRDGAGRRAAPAARRLGVDTQGEAARVLVPDLARRVGDVVAAPDGQAPRPLLTGGS